MKQKLFFLLMLATIMMGGSACHEENEDVTTPDFPNIWYGDEVNYQFVTEQGVQVTLMFNVAGFPNEEYPDEPCTVALRKCEADGNYSLTIPEAIEHVGHKFVVKLIYPKAFYHDTNLQAVSIPSGVQTIGLESVFNGCENLQTVTFADDSKLWELGYSTFYACKSLKAITIPARVGSIEASNFYGCENLTKVSFAGSRVRFIGTNAFAGCKSLTTITLPDSLKEIAADAFAGCDNLQTVYLKSRPKIDPSSFPAHTSLIYLDQK